MRHCIIAGGDRQSAGALAFPADSLSLKYRLREAQNTHQCPKPEVRAYFPANSNANVGFKGALEIMMFCPCPSIPKFAPEFAAK
jgi:hypothetical protein